MQKTGLLQIVDILEFIPKFNGHVRKARKLFKIDVRNNKKRLTAILKKQKIDTTNFLYARQITGLSSQRHAAIVALLASRQKKYTTLNQRQRQAELKVSAIERDKKYLDIVNYVFTQLEKDIKLGRHFIVPACDYIFYGARWGYVFTQQKIEAKIRTENVDIILPHQFEPYLEVKIYTDSNISDLFKTEFQKNLSNMQKQLKKYYRRNPIIFGRSNPAKSIPGVYKQQNILLRRANAYALSEKGWTRRQIAARLKDLNFGSVPYDVIPKDIKRFKVEFGLK